MLAIQVRHRLGAFVLDAELTVPSGRITVLVGESGSGKTTLLRLIAGLAEPDAGRIVLDDQVLTDRGAGTWRPAERRPVGYMAQDYALFPHLSVADNVAFGLRSQRLPARQVRERTDSALERFGIAEFRDRRPRALSGGQQQRVALARALVLDPEVLLLDEPLSAVDVAARRGVRAELRRTLSGLTCTTVFVTHHPLEALAIGDLIAVLENGRVTQYGSREDVVREPRSRYVAEFLGTNLFEGEIRSRGPVEAVVVVAGSPMRVLDPGRDGAVRVLVRPDDVELTLGEPSASRPRNVLRGRIEEIVPEPPAGQRLRVFVACSPPLTALVDRRTAEGLELMRGVEVYASFEPDRAVVSPPSE